MADVRPEPGNESLAGAAGAVVPVVGDAETKELFLVLVERIATNLEFDVVSLEDVELLEARIRRQALPSELMRAIEAIDSEGPLAFGSFHAYRA